MSDRDRMMVDFPARHAAMAYAAYSHLRRDGAEMATLVEARHFLDRRPGETTPRTEPGWVSPGLLRRTVTVVDIRRFNLDSSEPFESSRVGKAARLLARVDVSFRKPSEDWMRAGSTCSS